MNEAEALSRIEALENRITHQERVIDDLNVSVTRQWDQIDRLARQLEQVTDRLARAEENVASPGGPEPPPPHY